MSAIDADAVAAEIVALETAALERWLSGDPSGFLEISDEDVVYFDPFLARRLDGRAALTAYHYFGIFLRVRAFLGFLERALRDSWVVGITEGRPWTRPGSLILLDGWRLSSVLSGTRRGHGCARFMLRG